MLNEYNAVANGLQNGFNFLEQWDRQKKRKKDEIRADVQYGIDRRNQVEDRKWTREQRVQTRGEWDYLKNSRDKKDKRNQVLQTREDEEYNYLKARRPILTAREDRKFEQGQEDYKYKKERRNTEDAQSDVLFRWKAEDRVDSKIQAQIDRVRKEQADKMAESQGYYDAAMQAVDAGDMDTAKRLIIKGDEIGGGYLTNKAKGVYGTAARYSQEVSTGQRDVSDPEFNQAMSAMVEPTMRNTGRAKNYEFGGVEQLPNGNLSYRLNPKLAGGKYDAMINQYSQQYKVDPDLAKAVMMVESAGKKNAKSNKGAHGLMQVMPATFAEEARRIGIDKADSANPSHNIHVGMKYLADQLKAHNGDFAKALAAYNAGPGNVRKYKGVPPFKETQDYIKKVAKEYRKLKQGVPATAAMTSDKNDVLVQDTQQQAIQKIQMLAADEQEFNANTPEELKQALIDRVVATGGDYPFKKKKADGTWKTVKIGDDTVSHNSKTNEFKNLDGTAYEPDSSSTINLNQAPEDLIIDNDKEVFKVAAQVLPAAIIKKAQREYINTNDPDDRDEITQTLQLESATVSAYSGINDRDRKFMADIGISQKAQRKLIQGVIKRVGVEEPERLKDALIKTLEVEIKAKLEKNKKKQARFKKQAENEERQERIRKQQRVQGAYPYQDNAAFRSE